MAMTDIITPCGLYEFLGIPFRLKNTAQSFQRLMNSVCKGLDLVFVYIDDILGASKNSVQHKLHLCELFQSLKEHGLFFINMAKCQFGSS